VLGLAQCLALGGAQVFGFYRNNLVLWIRSFAIKKVIEAGVFISHAILSKNHHL
jgi:hypothetical protein